MSSTNLPALIRALRQNPEPVQVSYVSIMGFIVSYLRREREWTQRQLAHESGISQGTISRIELGEAEITVAQMNALAAALGVRSVTLIEIADDIKTTLTKGNVEISQSPETSKKERSNAIVAGAVATVLIPLAGTTPIGFALAAVASTIVARYLGNKNGGK